jgi:hypothetical protein
MPQPAGPQDAEAFVGRSRELAVLSAALRQAAAGDARLALVSGEPGIGKTELARAFAQAAVKDGALVLWGSAWEDGGAPPYWPWVQVLKIYARQAGATALADAAGPQAAVLGQLLPELGPDREPAGAGPAGSGSGARLTLFEAVCSLLDRASRATPLAVILDDLHAAGRPSALLLRGGAYRIAARHLQHRRGGPTRASATCRRAGVGQPRRWSWRAFHRGHQLVLPARAPTYSPWHRSEGNPLFIPGGAPARARRGRGSPVPAGIRRPSAVRSPGSARPEPGRPEPATAR